MMDTFSLWYDARHEYARGWKERTGGRVLGYFCTYFPEEILYAAGVLPVRILGSHEARVATDARLAGVECPFCRDCLSQGLEGRFDYLDGVGLAQSCPHIHRAFSAWQESLPVDFAYPLPLPDIVQSAGAVPRLRGELAQFRQAVEAWTGTAISDEDLRRGIEVMNKNRRLMRCVYEMRRADAPPVSGLEAMHMVAASQLVDKRDHSEELEVLLPRLAKRTLDRPPGARLMLIGSEHDDREFLRMVESLGALIVTDEHCTGSRYFWNQVEHDGSDPLQAIAERYASRPPCPARDAPRQTRIEHTLQLAGDYRVQGAILVQRACCERHEVDIPEFKRALEEELHIPALSLELDAAAPPSDQLAKRCEAFLETMRREDRTQPA